MPATELWIEASSSADGSEPQAEMGLETLFRPHFEEKTEALQLPRPCFC